MNIIERYERSEHDSLGPLKHAEFVCLFALEDSSRCDNNTILDIILILFTLLVSVQGTCLCISDDFACFVWSFLDQNYIPPVFACKL